MTTQKHPKTQFKPDEWKQPPKGTKWPKEKRREYIKKLAEELGIYNINRTELSEKMGISRRMLYDDFAAIIKGGLDKNELMHSKLRTNNALLKVMKDMQGILIRSKSDADRTRAAKVLIEATEAHTNFLERFGIKDILTPITDGQVIVKFGTGPKRKKK